MIDSKQSTAEQTILYSVRPVEVGDALSFASRIRISPEVLGEAQVVQMTQNDNYVTTKYKYDDYDFGIDVQVASVQTHNAVSAMKSAWGIDMKRLGIEEVD